MDLDDRLDGRCPDGSWCLESCDSGVDYVSTSGMMLDVRFRWMRSVGGAERYDIMRLP